MRMENNQITQNEIFIAATETEKLKATVAVTQIGI